MVVFERIEATRQWLETARQKGLSVGFVPTMGALHEGHIALVRRARKENDIVGCSIFVNPIQFNNPEDLEKYPRTLDEDLRMLREAGCDLVFVPSAAEMYPGPVTEKFDFGPLESVMEGAFRPGHFNGVAVVVKKLFNIFTPDRAYFGEKDFQQLRVIQALVKMESLSVEIVPCPTVREADGLAMSSRNRRLRPEDRAIAPEIYRTMLEVKEKAGNVSVSDAKKKAVDRLAKAGFIPEYVEIAAVSDLKPIRQWDEKISTRIFVACFLGNVRLIDNLEIFS
jgi:pantoate--beta-alanine ligase